MKRGHVAATVFFVRHARFCEKVLLRMKFSWIEFVRHEAGTK
jgi:hypothetical protein